MKLNIPEGQRKMYAMIITMVIGVVADKYFGGLNDNLTILIGGALALFVGGNAMEYVAQIKTASSKLPHSSPEKEEVATVVDEPEVKELTPAMVYDELKKVSDHVIKLDNVCGDLFRKQDEAIKSVGEDVKALQEGLELQINQTKQLVSLINKQRGVIEPTK